MNQQPYQEADAAIRSHAEKPVNFAKKAATIAAGVYGGSTAINRVLPFLSKYIPPGIAIKGLSKINPRLGNFMKETLNEGFGIDEIKDFITKKIETSQKQESPKKDSSNIVKQYSDELDAFITNEIGKGKNSLQAGAIAFLNPKFKSIINKITADHKTSFADILQTIYGAAEEPKQASQPQAMQQPQQQAQSGQGQQALMAILQKIQQARGAK